MKAKKCLHRVLVSHDAGWYEPHKPDGGTIRGYTTLFEKLVPALTQAGFDDKDFTQLLQQNPAKAFEVKVRKAK
jgi:phosphotriesterase-related protein